MNIILQVGKKKKRKLVVWYKTTTFTEAVSSNALQTLRIQLANNCSHFCLGKEVVSKQEWVRVVVGGIMTTETLH